MLAPELLHHLRGVGLVLTVMPAGDLHVGPRDALTDDHRLAIRDQRDFLLQALRVETGDSPPWRGGNSLLAPEQSDECHAGGWSDAEILVFTAMADWFIHMGCSTSESEHLAERLILRDRQYDDRRLCLECAHLQGWGRWRCGNWLAANAARDEQAHDLVSVLQRCVGFKAVWFKDGNSQMISENYS